MKNLAQEQNCSRCSFLYFQERPSWQVRQSKGKNMWQDRIWFSILFGSFHSYCFFAKNLSRILMKIVWMKIVRRKTWQTNSWLGGRFWSSLAPKPKDECHQREVADKVDRSWGSLQQGVHQHVRLVEQADSFPWWRTGLEVITDIQERCLVFWNPDVRGPEHWGDALP